MDEFFKWLSSNPEVAYIFVGAFVLFVAVVTFMSLTAFAQGREVSLWQFKIGARPITPPQPNDDNIKIPKPSSHPIEPNLQSIIDEPPQSSLQSASQLDTFVLSPAEVFETYSSTPLLQQQDLISHYAGVKLRFEGELSSAEKITKDRIRIMIFNATAHGGVVFEIDPTKHKGIGLLKTGHKMSVVGTITNFNDRVIYLKSVDLNF